MAIDSGSFQARMRQQASGGNNVPASNNKSQAATPDVPKRVPAANPVAAARGITSTPAPVIPDKEEEEQKPKGLPTSSSATFTEAEIAALTKFGPVPPPRPLTEEEQAALAAGERPRHILSDYERQTLAALGWVPGSPLPFNFADQLQRVLAKYAPQMEQKGLEGPVKVYRFEDLTPEQQTEVKSWFNEVAALAASQQLPTQGHLHAYPQGVGEAMRAADATKTVEQMILNNELTPITPAAMQSVNQSPPSPPIQQDLSTPLAVDRGAVPSTDAEAEDKAEDIIKPDSLISDSVESSSFNADYSAIGSPTVCNTCGCNPFLAKVPMRCTHCGSDPFEDLASLPIKVEDKRAFLVSVGSRRPFEKDYFIFGNTIKVRFRSFSTTEYEFLINWSIDMAERADSQRGATAAYYEMMGGLVLQTVSLRTTLQDGSLAWVAPVTPTGYVSLNDWRDFSGNPSLQLWDLVQEFRNTVQSEALIITLQRQLREFNQLDYNLSREGLNVSDFWKEI
jgi:predicted Zn-ribbon and HTH transcriptional regulator